MSFGNELILIGKGNKYEDFKWYGPIVASPGEINKSQIFGEYFVQENLSVKYQGMNFRVPNYIHLVLRWWVQMLLKIEKIT
jgi:hypothetical protein